MKNTSKVLGFIAVIAVIGFNALLMTGCQMPDESPTLTGIAITTQPTKTTYITGDTLSTEGMVVTATYSDGTTKAITDYAVSGFDSATAGDNKTVTVSYGGKTTTFTVKVSLAAVSIAVTTQPTKTVYAIGDTLNTAGMVVTATYSDNKTAAVTGYTTSGFDSATTGEKTVTVTYQDKTATFTVTVSADAASTPAASPAAGTYIMAQNVTLTTTATDATIYYTLDGTEPSASSTPYSTAITISTTTTLKAIAVKAGGESEILTATYTFVTPINMPDADKWVDGSLSSTANEQWFKFTATATSQYIHFQPGTLSGANVQLYSADGTTTVGASSYLSSSTTNISRTGLTANSVYYIKVSTSIISGTYKIAFNTTSSSPTIVTLPTTGVTELTVGGKWTDGNIPAAGGEQWFKFTSSAASGSATTVTNYIQFLSASMDNVYVQMYTTEGRTQGSRSNFTYLSYASQTGLTANTVYYIKVTPYSSTASGTYRIGVNTSSSTVPSITIPTTGVTPLTNNTWTDGNITSTVYEQWFSFTASAATTYIHFLPDALTSVSVQLYNDSGAPVGSSGSLNRGTASVYRSTSTSGTYYILLQPSSSYNGAYKIAYGDSSTQPSITVPSGTIPELTADTWADGNITTAGGEQWFKFTASATNQYIHFLPGALIDVYVRLFIADGTNVGDTTNLYASTISTTRTLNIGTVYFIKVTPYSTTSSGAYKIGFNTTTTTPKVTPSPVPTTGFVDLTLDVFSDGNIATAGGEQWFKFTSTATTQYIHFDSSGTLSDVNVQLYTDEGRLLGGRSNLYGSYSTYASRTVTNSTEYYIKVTPSLSTGKGAYKIGFNTSTTAPKITLPTTGVTTLTADKWSDGNIAAAGGEQWFKFTSAASGTSAYIYFQAGTLSSVYVQMYANDGRASGSRSTISSSYLSRTVTVSTEYYIKVVPYSSTGSGAFKLGVTSSSSTAPTP